MRIQDAWFMRVTGRRIILLSLGFLALPGQVRAQANCSVTSVGLTPLTELGTNLHKNFPGGLYPNGENSCPPNHLALGSAFAAEITPLDAEGIANSTQGKIVLLSIGMSNTTQEFSGFKLLADSDPAKNPRLVIVDGAQGGQTASAISDPNANFWTVVGQRLSSAGVTPMQVQVAWVKEANAGPTQAFPVHAQMLQSNLESIARILKSKYPNIRIAYFSSRIYAGYAQGVSTLNPEPYAYESGFAVKWLVEKQIGGDPTLTPSGLNPQAPWIAWGPYLWADGLTPRLTDGLVWECSDFAPDGTHPAASGRTKVASLLLNFFKTEPTAVPWFLKSGLTTVGMESLPVEFFLRPNYPNPFNPATTIEFSLPQRGRVVLKVFDVRGVEVETLVDEERAAGTYREVFRGSSLPSGFYVARLSVSGRLLVRKMLLVK